MGILSDDEFKCWIDIIIIEDEPETCICEWCEDSGYIGLWTCRECNFWSAE